MTETAEKKTDLRVVKTKRAIYAALERLLHKKSIDKITVAELSREAMINKGTFYLHYTDIFDLFQQALKLHMQEIADRIDFTDMLFTDPDNFSDRLVSISKARPLFSDDVFLQEGNRVYCQNAQFLLCESLAENVIVNAPKELTSLDTAKLRYIFAGAGSLLRYNTAISSEEISAIISSVIRVLMA